MKKKKKKKKKIRVCIYIKYQEQWKLEIKLGSFTLVSQWF